ncbi:MAG: TonB-dependent receptor [Ignavibacteriae bacterium]|nr:TonB-dependent receptor [Ignavibacteriota bacterium]
MKQILLIFFVFIFVKNNFSQNTIDYKIDSVVVSSNRIPLSFSEIGRSIETISSEEIKNLPVTNIQELCDQVSGIDIKQRGPENVQADVSIRGGSFEQTLILIDGIKLIDPQTGHHNLNLPINFSQIERVEILKGQGSQIYGANAFGGVINFITKKNGENNFGIELRGGENNYYNLGINTSQNLGNTFHNLTFTKSKSDGYRTNTEFENYNFSINNSFRFFNAILNTIYGYSDKKFGANSFYTIRFPNQAEKVKTNFASISADVDLSKIKIKPNLFWRNNVDEFVLNKFDELFYKNIHTTNSFGGEIQTSLNLFGEITSFGIEFSKDKIESNNLGNHEREKKGIFIEQIFKPIDKIHISIAGYAYKYSSLNFKFWPGIDLSFSPNNNFKIFANFGKAFRIPTYTELFYKDPVTIGNINLNPEESINYEIGLNYLSNFWESNFSVFRKEGKNLIDYILNEEINIWEAENLTEIKTSGFEIGFSINLRNSTNNILEKIKIDYTFLNSDKIDLGNQSRYNLEHLRNDLTVQIFNNLPMDIKQSWSLTYEDRINFADHFTIDTKLIKKFSSVEVFIKASNLLNKTFEEIPGVVLPGRWIIGGVSFNLH